MKSLFGRTVLAGEDLKDFWLSSDLDKFSFTFKPCLYERSFTQAYGYYLNEDKILLSKDGEGKTWLYLDGQGIDERLGEVGPRGALSYATDHLGSVLNGVAAGNRGIFGPFGETRDVSVKEHCYRGSGPVLYGFTGRQFDPESGKYYFRARMYDPVTGRFMSKDPIGLRGGINFYSYAKNDPLSFVDPMGNCAFKAGVGGDFWKLMIGGLAYLFGRYVILPNLPSDPSPGDGEDRSDSPGSRNDGNEQGYKNNSLAPIDDTGELYNKGQVDIEDGFDPGGIGREEVLMQG